MDNLGKENFWNDMHLRFSEAVNLFCTWIDEYKKEVGWNAMFGNIFPTEKKIKFHDIPYEMQMGIMNRFFIEAFASKEEFAVPERAEEYRAEMENALHNLNNKLNRPQK